MPLPPSIRTAVPLVLGLVVGAVGAAMFADSLPGAEGSPEERANKLEVELKRTQNELAAAKAAQNAPAKGEPDSVLGRLVGGDHRSGQGHAASDAARRIAENLRAGRPANVEDVFRASQPLMRDLSPLFNRMRVKEMKRETAELAGRLAREYELPPEKEKLLQDFFQQRAEQEAAKWSAMVEHEGTRLEDLLKATDRLSNRTALEDGLDGFMPSILDIQQQEKFKTERMNSRMERVEREADAGVNRLNSIVQLDEAQKDQVFGIMARTSRDYRPDMVIEGVQGTVGATPRGDRQSAVLSVLTPQQRALYDADKQRRRKDAVKDAEAVGLTVPEDWDRLDGNFP